MPALLNSGAQYASGQASRSLMYMNAGLAGEQAKSEASAGAYNEGQIRKKYAAVEGAQVNAIGANNLQVSGSALRMLTDTAKAGEMDALQTRNNALRKAFGYQVQAVGDRFQGDMDARIGTMRAVGTALNTATSLYTGAG